MRVVIALDGSPASQRALAFAGDLIAGRQVCVLMMHVIPEHLVYGKSGAVPAEAYDMPAERARATQLLEQAAQGLQQGLQGGRAADLTIEQRVALGDPADLILTAAESFSADLIVVGSRGLNAAQRFLIGSVSTKVATHAHCAVLVVHPQAS
jgi:nucleotide-binding universal stress UspA family protein